MASTSMATKTDPEFGRCEMIFCEKCHIAHCVPDNIAEVWIRRTEEQSLFLLQCHRIDGLNIGECLIAWNELGWLAESHLPSVRNWFSCRANLDVLNDIDEDLVVCYKNGHEKESYHRIRRKTLSAFGSYEYRAARNSIIDIGRLPDKTCCPKVSKYDGKRSVLRVALYPRAAGFLAHEVFGHPLETAFSVNRMIGEKVSFPDILSVIDNPGGQTLYGSYEYDSLGNKSQCVRCVTNGSIVDSIQGQVNSPRNLRRENCNFEKEPRMSNLEIIANSVDDNAEADLYLFDCLEGNEPTPESPIATIVGVLPVAILQGQTMSNVKVKCSFMVNEFSQNFRTAFGPTCRRPIDCYQEKSGWVRTSVMSPGFCIDMNSNNIDFFR